MIHSTWVAQVFFYSFKLEDFSLFTRALYELEKFTDASLLNYTFSRNKISEIPLTDLGFDVVRSNY